MSRDLVCGVLVDEKISSRFKYGGKSYYFCCEGCRKEFSKTPAGYLLRAA